MHLKKTLKIHESTIYRFLCPLLEDVKDAKEENMPRSPYADKVTGPVAPLSISSVRFNDRWTNIAESESITCYESDESSVSAPTANLNCVYRLGHVDIMFNRFN